MTDQLDDVAEAIKKVADQYNTVIMPMIRRVWPQLLANSIIGVQPITGPAASIFALKSRYRYTTSVRLYMIDPVYWKHFLRLNNRRTTFTPEQFEKAGYPIVELTGIQYKNRAEIEEWCITTFPLGSWCTDSYGLFVFSRQEYEVQFKLTWNEE